MKIYEKIGISEDEYKYLMETFSSLANISEAIIYGSRAKGTYKPFSDIDLTIKGKNLTERDIFRIREMFEDSSLPYLFDISNFMTLKNPSLIDHINRCGITIYAAH